MDETYHKIQIVLCASAKITLSIDNHMYLRAIEE